MKDIKCRFLYQYKKQLLTCNGISILIHSFTENVDSLALGLKAGGYNVPPSFVLQLIETFSEDGE